jgi:hypothetical protein
MTPSAFLESVLARCAKDGHNVDSIRQALAPYIDSETDSFDVAEALYWYGSDWHNGQWSLGYALLCSTTLEGYSPGPLASSVQKDSPASMLYDALVALDLR